MVKRTHIADAAVKVADVDFATCHRAFDGAPSHSSRPTEGRNQSTRTHILDIIYVRHLKIKTSPLRTSRRSSAPAYTRHSLPSAFSESRRRHRVLCCNPRSASSPHLRDTPARLSRPRLRHRAAHLQACGKAPMDTHTELQTWTLATPLPWHRAGIG